MPALGMVPPVAEQGKVLHKPLTGPSSETGAPEPLVVVQTHVVEEDWAIDVDGILYTRT